MTAKVPALDIDKLMSERYGHKLDARQHNERRIAWALLSHLDARGWTVDSIICDTVYRIATPKAAMELIFDLDESRVRFRNAAGTKHTVLLILGNGGMGEDMISDWGFTNGDPDGFDAAVQSFCDREWK